MENKQLIMPGTNLWAIERSWLDRIRMLGEDGTVTAQMEALAMRVKLESEEQPAYLVQDGVALVRANGPTVKRPTALTKFFGMIAYDDIRRNMAAALDDDQVQALVLAIDSPGGTVDGVMDFADWIHGQRGKKPMLGYADGLCCSAAMWYGSQLDGLYGSGSTMVGSISVLAVHMDLSGMDKQFGVKRSYLSTGKYKAMGNDAEPLSDEAREYLLGTMLGLHELFVDGISRGVGIDRAQAADLADGRVWLAAEAAAKGLLKAEKNLEETMAAAASLAAANQKNSKAQGKIMSESMTSTEIQAQHPQAAAELIEQGRSLGAQEAAAKAQAEQARMVGLCGLIGGKELAAKLEALAASGISTDQAEALMAAGLATKPAVQGEDGSAEQDMKKRLLAELQQSGQQNPGPGGTESKDFMAMAEQHARENKVSMVDAMKAVAIKHPDLHKACIEKANKQ